MKLKFALLFVIALSPMFARAQSALTIFSEDGDKFYLIMNGQKQNTVPMTNVRIDGLSQPHYAVKIIFEDKTKPEISKNVPVQDPSTSAYADVTYKIKRTKDGDLKIRYFSATPVEPNYVAPPDVYVMHWGQAAPPVSTTVTQTTVTSTNNPNAASMNVNAGGAGVNMNVNVTDPNMNSGNGGVNISMNVTDPNMNSGNGGVNISMNVADPNVSSTTTTRTTTTSTSTATSNYDNSQPVRQGCQYAMPANDFKSAKETVSKASFEDTKLSTAKTILSSNCFSTDQVIAICNLFSFEQSKLDFAKYAYSKCTDPGSYFKVGNIFSFDASKTELNNYISNGR
jgi:hypothetical protein